MKISNSLFLIISCVASVHCAHASDQDPVSPKKDPFIAIIDPSRFRAYMGMPEEGISAALEKMNQSAPTVTVDVIQENTSTPQQSELTPNGSVRKYSREELIAIAALPDCMRLPAGIASGTHVEIESLHATAARQKDVTSQDE